MGRMECAALPSRAMHHPVRYCALLPPSYDSSPTARYPVLYWLHGIGENEQVFIDAGGWNVVERLREDKRIGEFILITPDGDSTFFVNSRDGRRPWEDFFLREFLPTIEHEYRVRPGRANRAISGISMGGYGALHLAFRHPELFGAVSAHSAALMKSPPAGAVDASASNSQVRALQAAFGKQASGSATSGSAAQQTKSLVFDDAYWQANNPLQLARTAQLAGLKIYFDCGQQDNYGFDAGAITLDKELSARKIAHEFHLDPGQHDWVFAAQHLPLSLEFHWKRFTEK